MYSTKMLKEYSVLNIEGLFTKPSIRNNRKARKCLLTKKSGS